MNKKIILGIVIVLILGAIVYLESSKTDEAGTEVVKIQKQEEVNVSEPEQNTRIAEKAEMYPAAIELVEPEGYINTEEFKLEEYIGEKVILIDFWTYSCINCQRTLPYLNAWWDNYKDEGLLIVGIHTPEFEFEKDIVNVQRAVDKYEVEYPVVQDNDKQTWRAYKNRYWPRKYLIDIDGYIRYNHIGEGAYQETEEIIQELLQERREVLGLQQEELEDAVVKTNNPDFGKIRTREQYFGYDFYKDQLGNEEGIKPEQTVDYSMPEQRAKNIYYLDGAWYNGADYMELTSVSGEIRLKYTAKDVHIVAGSEQPMTISISTDGDNFESVEVQEHDLYTLISNEDYQEGEIIIRAKEGFRIYTFTFG